jgi:hypothetical protein
MRRELNLSAKLIHAAATVMLALSSCGSSNAPGGVPHSTLLDAIPPALAGFPGPINYDIAAAGGVGEAAGRLWMDAGETRLVVVQVSDQLSAAEALALFTEARAAYGAAGSVGDASWDASDLEKGGAHGFQVIQFTRGPYFALVGTGVMASGAAPLDSAALASLAASVDAELTARGGSRRTGSSLRADSATAKASVDLSRALSSWPPEGDCHCGASGDAVRVISEAHTTSMSFDLIKAGEKVGSITLKLVMTPTTTPCEEQAWGTITIVDIYIESITLEPGADDGDGAGRGDGDMMVGGNISISFTSPGGTTSVAMGGFATGEVGDVGPGGSSADDEDSELPKFIGQVKGCGIPTKIDIDLLLRDNDEGTDVQDILGAAAAAAAEYGAGSETGKRVGAAVDGMGAKPSDASGTDGMKLLRDRDKNGTDEAGDDVGEAHDKQTDIPSG